MKSETVYRHLLGTMSILLAAGVWLPCVHLFFRKSPETFRCKESIAPKARDLAARQLHLWSDPALRQRELDKMRASNAEWDFMGRSFLVWSLANLGLREPASTPSCLGVMDQIIDETIRLEQEHGMYFFLMPYATARTYQAEPARSLFVDGEIALMLASRQVLEEKPEYKTPLTRRISFVLERLQNGALPIAESYPDECWTFDHAVALAAIKLADHLEGTDHAAFLRDWIAMAKRNLVHRESGLLVSSFTKRGEALDGPEGTTIWMVAHCLQLIDEDFARDQYQRARKELGRTVCGFSYAREWPKSWNGPTDIDSGPIVPVLQISAGSSGMAFIGASAFGDGGFLSSLAATLDFAAFPSRGNGGLRYCASNQVGDAALLYAAVLGPLWEKVKTESNQ